MNFYLIILNINSILLTGRNVSNTDSPPSYEEAMKMNRPKLDDLPVAVNQDLRSFQCNECANVHHENRNSQPHTRNEERHVLISENPHLIQNTNHNETIITIETINKEFNASTNELQRFVNNSYTFERNTKARNIISLYPFKFSITFFLVGGILLGFGCYYSNPYLLIGFALSLFMVFFCCRFEDNKYAESTFF